MGALYAMTWGICTRDREGSASGWWREIERVVKLEGRAKGRQAVKDSCRVLNGNGVKR